MAHVYSDFVSQGVTFRFVSKGVLGLGLVVVYVHYDFALRGRMFRVVQQGSTRFRVDNGVFVFWICFAR
jgi:hypothetical protein